MCIIAAGDWIAVPIRSYLKGAAMEALKRAAFMLSFLSEIGSFVAMAWAVEHANNTVAWRIAMTLLGSAIFWLIVLYAIWPHIKDARSKYAIVPVAEHPSNKTASPSQPLAATKPDQISLIELRTSNVSEHREAGLRYPVKLYFDLANISKETIQLDPLDWVSNMRGAQLQVHPKDGVDFKYNLEGKESQQITVPPGRLFQLWIGINENHPADFLHDRRVHKQLGTIIIPGHIVGGPKFEQRFQV